MELLANIKACQTMEDLDGLRKKIHQAASKAEIDFKVAKAAFLKKKVELRDKKWGYQA